MKKFEYHILHMDISSGFLKSAGQVDYEKLYDHMADLGDEGWELVNTMDTNHYSGNSRDLILFFKREKLKEDPRAYV